MGDKSSAPARTPAKTPSTAKNSSGSNNTLSSSTAKQQSILGFFSKSSTQTKLNGTSPAPKSTPTPRASSSSSCLKETTTKSNSLSFAKRPSTITPVPSSDAVEPLSSQENRDSMQLDTKVPSDSLPSPGASSELDEQAPAVLKTLTGSSPSRKVCRFLITTLCLS